MEELIIKYLADKLTDEEEQRLKAWLLEDQANRNVFENMVAEWRLARSDIEQSKARVYNRLSVKPRMPKRRQRSILYFSKAAAVLILAGITTLFIFYNRHDEGPSAANVVQIEKQAPPGQKLKIKLPDGTFVMLNSGSRIISPEHFEGAERKVRLTGEAFFDVAKDPAHPFVIETSNLEVRVLGTSFNVRSFTDEDSVSVAVLTGNVMVSDHPDSSSGKQQVLLPNEMLVYSVKEKVFFEKRAFDSDVVFGWKDHNLVFKDATIHQMLVTLSRWYGVEFTLQTRLDHGREFTGSFKNPTLRQVMESISYNYQFEYEIHKDSVLIK